MTSRTQLAGRVAGLVAVLVVTGCSTNGAAMPDQPQPPGSPAPSSGTAPASPVPSATWPSGRPSFQTVAPTGAPATVPAARWQAILDDLATRGVTGEPTVETAERVTWPDSSLGCPSPGAMYTQALVDGMRVVLVADGQRYDYRFGSGDQPKLCPTRH